MKAPGKPRRITAHILRALTGTLRGAAKVIKTSRLSCSGSLAPHCQPALLSFLPVGAAKEYEAIVCLTGIKRSPDNWSLCSEGNLWLLSFLNVEGPRSKTRLDVGVKLFFLLVSKISMSHVSFLIFMLPIQG